MLPLRPPQEQGRQLAGRVRLPDLRGPRRAHTGHLPRLRPGAGASRPTPRRRRRDLRRAAPGSRSPSPARAAVSRASCMAAGSATRCTLADRLADLLDDGTGRIRPELVPLADCLLAMDNPLSGLTWLCARKGRPGPPRDLLRRLGRGRDRADPRGVQRPPALAGRRPPAGTPDGLRRAPRGRQADLLVRAVARRSPRRASPTPTTPSSSAASPPGKSCPGSAPAQRRSRSPRPPAATPSIRSSTPPPSSTGSLSVAAPWPACRQADIDAWYAENNEHGRITLRAFLNWCMHSQADPALPAAPGGDRPRGAALRDDERLDAARPRS